MILGGLQILIITNAVLQIRHNGKGQPVRPQRCVNNNSHRTHKEATKKGSSTLALLSSYNYFARSYPVLRPPESVRKRVVFVNKRAVPLGQSLGAPLGLGQLFRGDHNLQQPTFLFSQIENNVYLCRVKMIQ